MSSVGNEDYSEEIVKMGYLKKLKTMKKKFFVLRDDTESQPACLQYYDTAKKWKNGYPPKRVITLKSCFNINRRTDTKHKYVLALYTKSDCFSIVLEYEDDLQQWLRALLIIHLRDELRIGIAPKPRYEHVWRVTVQKKELATRNNLSGCFLLCLSDITLTLAKPSADEESDLKCYEFSLQCIRRCGNLDSFFYMELGQASCLGSGNLWMQVEDSTIAQNMHVVIMNACTNCPKKELAPKSRSRSSSANESSKPSYFAGRKWLNTGDSSVSSVSHCRTQSQQDQFCTASSPVSSNQSVVSLADGLHHPNSSVSFCSPYPPIRRASTGTRPVTNVLLSNSSVILPSGSALRSNASYTGRERCDSMPSRQRNMIDPYCHARSSIPHSLLQQQSLVSRHSMYNRAHTAFLPSCSNPTSPLSGGHGSSDSAGSSLSMDGDAENWSESENCGRYLYSATDKPVIPEENSEEYVQWGSNNKSTSQADDRVDGCICQKTKPSIVHSNSSSQSSYSPCSSSPLDNAGSTYLPLSHDSANDFRSTHKLNRSFDSVNHSRESSIHDEAPDSEAYMHMAPRSTDTGYTSMLHTGDMSPGLSSSSVTSGTPSTDAQLSEFHLERVSSYLAPSDEEIIFIRPVRAYSTGSKPDVFHNKFQRYELDGLRARAFSVGSHVSPTVPSSRSRTPNSASASSFEPYEDDLVEIDFSTNKKRNRGKHPRPRRHSTTPLICNCERFSVPVFSAQGNTYSSPPITVDYNCDGSPKSSPKLNQFHPSEYVTSRMKLPFGRSPPKLSGNILHRDLRQSFNIAKSSPPIGNILPSTLERVTERSLCEYVPISVSQSVDVTSLTPGLPTHLSTNKSGQMLRSTYGASNKHSCHHHVSQSMTTAHVTSQPSNNTHIQSHSSMDQSNSGSYPLLNYDDAFAYMEMKPQGATQESFHTEVSPAVKKSSNIRGQNPNPSVDNSISQVQDGYVDMNFSKNKQKSQSLTADTNKQSDDARPTSKPIAIHQSKTKRLVSSSFFRKKSIDETAQNHTKIPSFLPLSISIPTSFSSLGRKHKKNVVKNEKNESSMFNTGAVFPLSPESSTPEHFESNDLLKVAGSGTVSDSDYLDAINKMLFDYDGNNENGDYSLMTPSKGLPLRRKISEPSNLSKLGSKIRNPIKQIEQKRNMNIDRKKLLIRSTSVPTNMSVKNSSPPISKQKVLEIEQSMSKLHLEISALTPKCKGSKSVDSHVDAVPAQGVLFHLDDDIGEEGIYTEWSLRASDEEESPYTQWSASNVPDSITSPSNYAVTSRNLHPNSSRSSNHDVTPKAPILEKTSKDSVWKKCPQGAVTYASLDLPVSEAGNCNQNHQLMTQTPTISNKCSNTYAKIDFDKTVCSLPNNIRS